MTEEPGAVFDDDMDARFANSVSDLRKARGWSQDRLAELLTARGVRDITALAVSRIESGRRKVRLNEAVALSQVFGVPLLSMTKQDPTLKAVIMLSGQVRQLRLWEFDFLESSEQFASRVHETAHAVLRAVENIREQGDLDADIEAHLLRFERRAQYALAHGPADVAASVPWPWEKDETDG